MIACTTLTNIAGSEWHDSSSSRGFSCVAARIFTENGELQDHQFDRHDWLFNDTEWNDESKISCTGNVCIRPGQIKVEEFK